MTAGRDGLSWGDGELAVTLSAPGAELAGDHAPGDHAAGVATVRWRVRLDGRGTSVLSWRLTVTDPAASVIAAPGGAPRPARVTADDPRLRSLSGGCWPTWPHCGWPCLAAQVTCSSPPARRGTSRSSAGTASGPPACCCRSAGSSPPARSARWRLSRAASSTRRPRRRQARSRTSCGAAVLSTTARSTPPRLWICLLHDAWRWGMPGSQVRALLPALHAALECISRYGDSDGDGLLEYVDQSGHGLSNQGWKDSGDSIRFRRRPRRQAPGRAVRGAGVRLRGGHGGGRAADRVRRARCRPLAGLGGWAGGGVPRVVLAAGRVPGARPGRGKAASGSR